MDAQSQLRVLEDACGDFQVPSTRIAAEQTLINFRNTATIQYTQYFLENSTKALVQFEAASALKLAIIREWALLTPQQLDELQNYLISFTLQYASSLQPYVREQLLLTVAIIIKGAWQTSRAARISQLLEELLAKFHGTIDDAKKCAIISLLLAIVKEFSSSKASALGFTWEYHFQCRRGFEMEALQQIFLFALRCLMAGQTQVAQLQSPVVIGCLNLTETILQWEFTSSDSRKFAGTFAKADSEVTTTQISFAPPTSWRDLMLSNDLTTLFFKMHVTVLGNASFAHHTRQCLVQLAALTGPVFPDPTVKIDYASRIVNGILELMDSIAIAADLGPELLGISQMIKRLTINFRLLTLIRVAEFGIFVDRVLSLTLFALEKSISEVEDTWNIEAFDELLEAWMSLWNDTIDLYEGRRPTHLFPAEQLKALHDSLADKVSQIFRTYVDTRLKQSQMSDADGVDEDQMLYEDQLVALAVLGRARPGDSLDLLMNLLQERAVKFQALLQAAQNGVVFSEASVIQLHEGLHWLILLTGHVMADTASGEKPQIPSSILSLSIAAEKRNPTRPEVVIAISRFILGLYDLLSFVPEALERNLYSPLVSKTLLWFTERWCQSYLFVEAKDYARMSSSLINAFGASSEASGVIVDFLLSKLRLQFLCWSSEQDVIHELIRLLMAFAKRKNVSTVVLHSESWPHFMGCVLDSLSIIPETEQSTLVQALCCISSAPSDKNGTSVYLQRILDIAEGRLVAMLHRPDFPQVFQQAQVSAQIVIALEMFRGIVMASDASNWRHIFNFCRRYLEQFIALLDLYHTAPEIANVILNFFSCLIGSQISYMSQQECVETYKAVSALLQTYSKGNLGKRQFDEAAEESQLQDLLALLRLLANLISKDFLDFSDGDVFSAEVFVHGEPGQVAVADVVFYGLAVVIPLLPVTLLRHPGLCEQYFKLIVFMCEIYPEKLVTLPSALFVAMIQSLEFGLEHYMSDIALQSFQAVTGMAAYCVREIHLHGPEACSNWRPILGRLLQQLMQMILFKDFEPSLLETASEAVFALICADFTSYTQIVQQILSNQPKIDIRNRLSAAFESLLQTNNIQPVLDREQKKRFRDNFEHFLTDVRGFLRVR